MDMLELGIHAGTGLDMAPIGRRRHGEEGLDAGNPRPGRDQRLHHFLAMRAWEGGREAQS